MMRKLLPLLLLVVVLLLDHLIQLNDSFLILSGPDVLNAIGLGLGAVSGFGNVFSSARSNSQNMKINRMNNEFNAREAEKARQYQTEMWNKTNDWNSPKNVRKRLQEAGYNPYLGLDSSNVGTAQSAGSSSPASAAPPIQNNPVQFDGFQNAISTAIQLSNSTKVSNAEVDNLQGQKGLADAQAAASLSGIDWYKFSPEYRNWLQTTGMARAQLSFNTDRQNLENMQWINKIQRAQRTDILLSNDAKRTINKYLDSSQSLQLNMMANQSFQAFAAGRLSLQQCKTEVAKQLMYMAETEGQKISNRVASETADQLIGALQWQYSSDEMFSRGYAGYARQAGQSRGKGDIAKGQLDEYNYSSRYWNTAVESIGRIGNGIGLPLMLGRGLRSPQSIKGFRR
nr:MAG TPA: DNA pilot protein VP2 [Microviridae sp.]